MNNNVYIEFEEERTTVGTNELKNILINNIPPDNLIEIADVTDDGIFHMKFEGEFGWNGKLFCAFIRHDWYRKYWDLPLGLAFHMDLMRRLVEFRFSQDNDIANIQFEDDGDWCHLNYEIIIPNEIENLEEAFRYAMVIEDWIDRTVSITQENISGVVSNVIAKYNENSLLMYPELINKVKTTKEIEDKGKYLEELIVRFFSEVQGFKIIERKRTKTEEIDIVIINDSEQNFWKSESNLILVECKNWNKPAGKNEYVAFREKLENRRGRAKLGFFVSAKGFAKTFELEDMRNSKTDLLIIPIDLKQIISIIDTQNNFTEELQKLYVEATTK